MKKQRSSKSLWPLWFPYPSSWLRSLVLSLWMSVVLRIELFWSVLFGAAYFGLTKRLEPLIGSVCLALTASFTLFSYTHHFLWSRSPVRYPKWLPSPKSLWEGFYAAIVMTIAIAISFACVIPLHDPTVGQVSEAEVKWLTIIWFTAASYLYQAEYLIRMKGSSRRN